MNLPKISIVTPSYNHAAFLERTILSVLNQNYPNLEYIIIDGGSTDGSIDIIKKYEEKIHFWVSEKDDGMYYALQKGFEKSSGEIMGWINSDDVLQFNSLFTLGQIFLDLQNVQWIQGYPNVIDHLDRSIFVRPYETNFEYSFYSLGYLQTNNFIQQESTFWRRSLWVNAGSFINTKYRYAADFELWIRFLQIATLFNVNALLGSFRIHVKGQLSTSNKEEYINETRRALVEYPLSRKKEKRLQWINFLIRLQDLLKLVNISPLIEKSKKKYFNSTSFILFNTNTQTFYIK